jgi:translocator protein
MSTTISGRKSTWAWWKLATLLAIVFAIATFGAAAANPKLAWYAGLEKPGFAPPPWVFAPVWIALYAVTAAAAWRVWEAPADSADKREALGFFAIQLALNAVWAPVFFGLQKPVSALVIIVFMLAAIWGTMRRFLLIDPLAGWMLAPYLAWVAFAVLLNAAIVGLNP